MHSNVSCSDGFTDSNQTDSNYKYKKQRKKLQKLNPIKLNVINNIELLVIGGCWSGCASWCLLVVLLFRWLCIELIWTVYQLVEFSFIHPDAILIEQYRWLQLYGRWWSFAQIIKTARPGLRTTPKEKCKSSTKTMGFQANSKKFTNTN